MKLIYTSANINFLYEIRKNEYIDSFNELIKYFNPNDIYILECFSKNEEYLNNLSSNIYYNTNIGYFKNKGVKEITAIKNFLLKYNFDDDDLITKITGRYKLLSNRYINSINNDDYDGYFKMGENNQLFTGLFSLKFKYLLDFINNIDLTIMEKNMINLEKLIYDYVINNKLNVKFIETLDLYSNINNETKIIW